MKAVKKGDWVFITGSRQINQSLWDKSFPQGFFGRIIEINKRYSSRTGERYPDKILVRTYRKGSRPHITTTKEFLKII